MSVTATSAQPFRTAGRPAPRPAQPVVATATPRPDALVRQRTAEARRALSTVTGRLRILRDAEQALSALPASQRTPGLRAALRRLRDDETELDRVAADLRRRLDDAKAYAGRLADQRRIASALGDVELAVTELRDLPPEENTPYLTAAARRLERRRTELRREWAATAKALSRLERRLSAPLPTLPGAGT